MFTPSMYCGQPSFRTHFRFSYIFFLFSQSLLLFVSYDVVIIIIMVVVYYSCWYSFGLRALHYACHMCIFVCCRVVVVTVVLLFMSQSCLDLNCRAIVFCFSSLYLVYKIQQLLQCSENNNTFFPYISDIVCISAFAYCNSSSCMIVWLLIYSNG